MSRDDGAVGDRKIHQQNWERKSAEADDPLLLQPQAAVLTRQDHPVTVAPHDAVTATTAAAAAATEAVVILEEEEEEKDALTQRLVAIAGPQSPALPPARLIEERDQKIPVITVRPEENLLEKTWGMVIRRQTLATETRRPTWAMVMPRPTWVTVMRRQTEKSPSRLAAGVSAVAASPK